MLPTCKIIRDSLKLSKIQTMKQKCQCCQRPLTNVMNKSRKYCSGCSVHSVELRREISKLKNDIMKLKLKLYGQKNGSERIRFKK